MTASPANAPARLRLGKLPARPDAVKFKLSSYLDTSRLPTPPSKFGHYGLVTVPFGMLGNDRFGCCLVEGTRVSAPDVGAAHRIPYTGPIVTLTTASGKRLSVTPNHAVLTSRGFVRAQNLQHGDDLVGTSGTEVLPGPASFGAKGDFNDVPAPVEQVFSTLTLRGCSTRKIVPASVDLHGDERFVNGDVNVVGADSLLWGKLHTSLRQPYAEDEIGSARQLQRGLVSAGSALLALGRSFLPSHGNVSLGGYGPPLSHAQAGIAQAQRLSLRPEDSTGRNDFFFEMPAGHAKFAAGVSQGGALNVPSNGSAHVAVPLTSIDAPDFGVRSAKLIASVDHPASDGAATDPEFFADLCEAYPGLVAADRVIQIDVNWHSDTHVYDLSTASRWYIAEGLITHNCVWAGAAHETMIWCREAGVAATFNDATVLSDYAAVTGFNPKKPATDQGTDMTTAASYRRKTGVVDSLGQRHKVDAYLAIKPRDVSELKLAAYLFGAVGIGIEFPSSAMDQFNAGKPWSVVSHAQIEGGHYVPCVGFDGFDFLVVTWGKVQRVTPGFLTRYCDEAIAYVSLERLTAGKSLDGFDIAALRADLAALPTAA